MVSITNSLPAQPLDAAGAGLMISALCLFMAAYAVGVGPVNMVLMAEIFPYHLRATAMSLGLFVNRLVSGIVASTFLSISHGLTPQGAFFAFGLVSTLSYLFVFKLVPETRGKSLEEMEAFFAKLVEGGVGSNVELDQLDDATDDSPREERQFDKLATDDGDEEDEFNSGKSNMM